jgi:hypothetical protein
MLLISNALFQLNPKESDIKEAKTLLKLISK